VYARSTSRRNGFCPCFALGWWAVLAVASQWPVLQVWPSASNMADSSIQHIDISIEALRIVQF